MISNQLEIYTVSNGDAKITPVCVLILPQLKLPPYSGGKVDLFWNGSESEGYNVWVAEMLRFARSREHDCVGG